MKYKIIIILLLVFSCQTSNKNTSDFKSFISVDEELIDTLKAKKKLNDPIFLMNLKLKGKSSGKINFMYSHKPYENFYSIKLNSSFEKIIETDWYEPECLIKIVPDAGVVLDSLLIEYSFN